MFDLREKYLQGNAKEALSTYNFVSLRHVEGNELTILRMYPFLIRRTPNPKTVLGWFFLLFVLFCFLSIEFTLGNKLNFYLVYLVLQKCATIPMWFLPHAEHGQPEPSPVLHQTFREASHAQPPSPGI